ncbi:MAG: ATP-binding protein [Pirellulales bacterium]
MGLMQQIHSGRTQMPPRIMAYGIEGVGKSTLAANTPRPIFIQTEDGLGEINCDKFPLARSFDEVIAALTELATDAHPYETVVIDSLDWLERMIWDVVCKRESVTTIEKVGGGYGKGYVLSLDHWRKLIDRLIVLHYERQMLVFLTAHAKVERFEDPEAPAYDRYSPRLNKHAAALITEWCDAVLFATRRFVTRSEDAGFGRQRAIATAVGAGGGERVLRTVGGPSCVAKNRYRLKPEIPLTWDAIIGGILAGTAEPSTSNPTTHISGDVAHG